MLPRLLIRGCARPVAAALACLIALPPAPGLGQEAARPKLNIVIVEGDGAINNIRQRTAREPIVQVEDENRKPIAGATVTFLLPRDGAGALTSDGSRSFTAVTDQNGRATLRGMKPNERAGKFQIQVNASFQGLTASTVITQTNVLAAAAVAGGVSAKLIAILAIAGGAAAAGGIIAATRGNGDKPPAAGPIVIAPGTPSVGNPR